MKAVMPQEIEVWYILPALRREFSKILVEKGLSQREIAKKLYLTEAAVSQYLHGKRGNDLEFDEITANDIRGSVEIFLKTGNLVGEFQQLCTKIRKSKLLCKIHEKYGTLPEECKLYPNEIICVTEENN
ncbi:MAG: helix-turn-helix domain-containing protein [Nanoarchaeota archaeon]